MSRRVGEARPVEWNGLLPGTWRVLDTERVPADAMTVKVLCVADRHKLDRDLDRSRYRIYPKVSR